MLQEAVSQPLLYHGCSSDSLPNWRVTWASRKTRQHHALPISRREHANCSWMLHPISPTDGKNPQLSYWEGLLKNNRDMLRLIFVLLTAGSSWGILTDPLNDTILSMLSCHRTHGLHFNADTFSV